VLERREVRRLGSNATLPIDGRTVAATNRNLTGAPPCVATVRVGRPTLARCDLVGLDAQLNIGTGDRDAW
jgi:hypothetical protein